MDKEKAQLRSKQVHEAYLVNYEKLIAAVDRGDLKARDRYSRIENKLTKESAHLDTIIGKDNSVSVAEAKQFSKERNKFKLKRAKLREKREKEFRLAKKQRLIVPQ